MTEAEEAGSVAADAVKAQVVNSIRNNVAIPPDMTDDQIWRIYRAGMRAFVGLA